MFKKIVPILIFICLFSIQAYSQCYGTYQWPMSVVMGPTVSAPESIIYCNHPGDYSIITGIVAGTTYVVTNINYDTSANGYITVTSLGPGGPPVGHGVSPYTFTAEVSGNHYVHVFANSSCSRVGGCFTTTITREADVPIFACGTTFYDSGGPSGHYSNNENKTTILYPDNPGELVTATFTDFHIETGWDFLNVYDGPNASFPPFPGSPFTGTTIPGPFTSTHSSGALTFVFTSDVSGNNFSGWAAGITCGNSHPCNLIISDSIFPVGADPCNLEYTELIANEVSVVSVFLEDFSTASLPSGWVFDNGNTSFASWSIQNSTYAGGSGHEAELSYNGQGSNNWSLRRSSPINITGYTNLHLSFKHSFDHFQEGPMSMYVETATNAGGPWTAQFSLINQVLNVYGTEHIDIASLDGNTALYLRFRFSGSTQFLNRWAIDDIQVTADSVVPAQTSWSPIVNLYIDSNVTIPYTGQLLNVVYAAPNGTQLYTATDQNGCTDDINVIHNKKTWNGSVDDDWYKNANWTPSGIPQATNCVTIPDAALSSNISPSANIANLPQPLPPTSVAVAKTLTVKDNGKLFIERDTYLEVTDWVTVEPTGELMIHDSGSLVQVTDITTNNNSGNIRMQRTVPGGVSSQNYVYWSSPVEGFNVANLNTTASALRYEWNPTIDGIHNGIWIPAEGEMNIGKGYIVRGLATGPSPFPANTAEFFGRPNNGIINTPIGRGTYNGDPYPTANGGNTMANDMDDNWNLVGNPYPSAISGDAFITANTSVTNPKIEGTIYLWSHLGLPTSTTDPFYGNYVYNYLGSDYVAYNGTGSNPPVFNGNIAAGQSFFVQMLDGAGIANTVTFNNSMRSGNPANDNFLRTSERHRIWLDLITQNDVASSMLVGYVSEATNDKDRLYDGHNLSDSTLQFYSLIGNDAMTIQGRALPFDQEDKVPLGFIVPQKSSYTIAINTMDGLFNESSQNIYLEDTYKNFIFDLRMAPYTFTSESGTFNDRFILRYTDGKLSTPDAVGNLGFKIIGLNDYIKVTSRNSPISTVKVYDILGGILADYKDINAIEFKLELINQSRGALIVKATLYNGQQKIKKVIYR